MLIGLGDYVHDGYGADDVGGYGLGRVCALLSGFRPRFLFLPFVMVMGSYPENPGDKGRQDSQGD
ncbi:hypothetical protein B5M10_03075 [Pluralibacter gergoviae]|nr:hypothetical protein SS31_20720 [Pluralibacter gergoviae]OUR04215.1 hypothetical protein B5M10_03075 [Pluralibacter gergoviae]